MSITFREVRRENVPLLLGFAGGTGSGKTYSALRVARGIAGGHPFAFVDTENGRAKHYADAFSEMRHGEIKAPFRPDKYADAIAAGEAYLDAQKVPTEHRVVVVDSASHEWYGEGGCLDWHDELAGGDMAKNLTAWIEPKKSHKRMVQRLLQMRSHVILCFRAEEKVEVIDDPQQAGRKKIVPKPSLTGLDGWIPISEKNMPYELTASFLLMANRPGVPLPIKLPGDLKPLVSLEHELDEDAGKRLAAWAAGPAATPGGADARGGLGAPELPDALTPAEFKARREAAGISVQAVGAKGRELFAGRSSGSLNDAERAQLWKALQPQEEALV